MFCECCEELLKVKYGSERFCSVKCARSFSTKLKRGDINEKVSLKLKGKPSTGTPFQKGFDERRGNGIQFKKGHVPVKVKSVINDDLRNNILRVVTEEKTMKACANKLNMSFYNFRKTAKELNVYNPNPSGKGLIKSKLSLDDIFSGKVTIRSSYLRERLIKEGIFQNECANCFIKDWLSKPISLELDHIDGDKFNNKLENLRILCPNCHSQTDTYKGKNIIKNKHDLITDEVILNFYKKGNSINNTIKLCGMSTAGNYKRFKKLYNSYLNMN